ncbi:MAG: hypothetical protein AAF502_09390 [Bacteroidota bacterium]
MSNKIWKETAKDIFAFFLDGKKVGTLQKLSDSKTKKAVVLIDGEVYTIERIGFWLRAIEIQTLEGELVARAAYDKLYSTGMTLDLKGKTYKLYQGQSSGYGWVLREAKTEVLSYRYNREDGHNAIEATTSSPNLDPLLDFLLYYLTSSINVEEQNTIALVTTISAL